MTGSAALLALVLSMEPTPPPEPAPFARRAVIPLVISGVMLVGAATFLTISVVQVNDAQRLEGEPREALLSSATSNRVGGVLLAVTAGLTGALAAFLFFFRPAPTLSFSLSPLLGGGAFVSFDWRLP